jgi:hypothetical protein
MLMLRQRPNNEFLIDCYTHAENCRRSAAIEPNAILRMGFIDVEQRWLRLAKSIELAQGPAVHQPTAIPRLED